MKGQRPASTNPAHTTSLRRLHPRRPLKATTSMLSLPGDNARRAYPPTLIAGTALAAAGTAFAFGVERNECATRVAS